MEFKVKACGLLAATGLLFVCSTGGVHANDEIPAEIKAMMNDPEYKKKSKQFEEKQRQEREAFENGGREKLEKQQKEYHEKLRREEEERLHGVKQKKQKVTKKKEEFDGQKKAVEDAAKWGKSLLD